MAINYVRPESMIGTSQSREEFRQMLAAHPTPLAVPPHEFEGTRNRLANLVSKEHRAVWVLGSRKRTGELSICAKQDGPCPCGRDHD